MSVLGTSHVARVVATSGVLLLLLAGCAPQAGGGADNDDTSQGTDNGTNDGDESNADDGDDGDEFVAFDPCTFLSDAALTAGLGSAPGERTPGPLGSTDRTCYIYGTSDPNAVLNISYNGLAGRDGFETQRGYKEGITDLYQPLTGIGDDAFAFGSEVTVLIGDQVLVLFLEGLYFDTVDPAERLERTKNLALEAVSVLG